MMNHTLSRILRIALALTMLVIFLGVSNAGPFLGQKVQRTVQSYEKIGRDWGAKLWKTGYKPGLPLNDDFVESLKDNKNIDFFNVHADLKEAFKRGFRMGYEDRTADLALGPHLTAAAGKIGLETSQSFVDVINAFEFGWAQNIRKAVDVFIVLISEGSQSDREVFIKNFTDVYESKFIKTQQILKEGGYLVGQSQGGTMLFIDYTKGNSLAALDIPAPEDLKSEIYKQTFKVMGDEWGRRFSTNLITRPELVDLLRRSRTAFQETPADVADKTIRLRRNLGIVQEAFIKSYGTDADNVFKSLLKEAEYTEIPLRADELRIDPNASTIEVTPMTGSITNTPPPAPKPATVPRKPATRKTR
jgi:hypothetical protein